MVSESQPNITAVIESLLFVASGPVPIGRIAKTLDITPKQTEQHLYQLQETYVHRGLNLEWSNDGVQLTSAPEMADKIESFLGLETTTRLSPAVLEVLAIIAYMQPVTRPQIDRVRGVNSDGSLRKLLTLSLIEEIGRMDAPGRPILYATTSEFLQHFGLSSLEQLPALPEDEQVTDDAIDDILAELEETEDAEIDTVAEQEPVSD